MNHLINVARVAAFALLLIPSTASSLDVKLTPSLEYIDVIHDGKLVRVQRIQDLNHRISGSFAKTARKCPPFCIQPMAIAPGVHTVAELEVFEFMQNQLLDRTGVIVDARTPTWYRRGTIPGSINIPFTTFTLEPDDSDLIALLDKLGVKHRNQIGGFTRALERLGFMGGDNKTDNWDFSSAKHVLIWCNGAWCEQSPRAIRGLLDLGYPAEKLHWYRGGMQMWQIMGLTTVIPE